jgi:hypothetical protein
MATVVLPNFLVMGAAKCGTTSLANHLRSHPDVFVPEKKELNFFDVHWHNGLSWYEEWFADATGERAIGEASPAYMFIDGAAERAAQTVPDARIIVMLREPVARVHSHYWHRVREDVEHRSFDEMIDQELRGEGESWGYVGRSRYLPQLRRLDKLFGADSVQVHLLDDLAGNPAGVVEACYRHLDVDPTFRPLDLGTPYNLHYEIVRPRLYGALIRLRAGRWLGRRLGRLVFSYLSERTDYADLSPSSAARLRRHFDPDLDELSERVGRDLRSTWYQDPARWTA